VLVIDTVDAKQPYIAAFSTLAARFGVHFILGSLNETDAITKKNYITTVVISDEGKMIGRYRKRRIQGNASDQSGGDDNGLVTTRFGDIAILTCLDIEAIDVLEKTLSNKPVLIFNPSCITPPSGSAATGEFIQSTWRLALDTTSRRFERLASKHSTTIIR
jgi:predicted amidohydrolase